MQPTAETIYQCLGDLVFGEDGDTLQDVVVRVLAQSRQTLATVECGSGGTLAAWLSNADPDLRVFRGGWVLRDPAAIAGVLGTTGHAAESRWPLTESGVQSLAAGCRANFQTDYALALGPFPPAGESSAGPSPVYIAIAAGEAVRGHSTPYAGHPDILLARTVKEALNFLRLWLLKGA
jgi:nicotinamide-nucleotide amidase